VNFEIEIVTTANYIV